ncbi:DNA topoisomerase IV, alpha subunit [Sporormia fimetaria CBS 119925]|uniref:DNA topoisomerase (ATP-hydrolyzing) n=1 Tax=Sporormia fimetaria CBS 119925 TaxID=1340428 RepID=A0A6A6V303_9PLEO|nr:DNA topoisomerase IV, alpha subunit [Sporormia fimetaria CBS 119925]
MLEKIVDALLAGDRELSITLVSHTGASGRALGLGRQQENNTSPVKTRRVKFPGANAQEAWRFAVLLRILELVHDGLVENVVMTKRDIYYRHPDLFLKQGVVDRYIDDLACTLGLSRSSLNVTAAAKGLVVGYITIRRADGTSGNLMPALQDSDTLHMPCISSIVVIEKEATFRSLLSSCQWDKLSPHTLIVTAKGYPDLATRRFLCRVANTAPHTPIFALVDFDPDGIAIMSTYKYGSSRLAHETMSANSSTTLALPQLHWLGLRSRHWTGMTDQGDSANKNSFAALQGLMALTPRDRAKACQMLKWGVCTENGMEPTWRRELQVMLMLNMKAEIQILEEGASGLVPWLVEKLAERRVQINA